MSRAFFCCFLLAATQTVGARARSPVESGDLGLWLKRLDRTAELYRDRALGFSCVEMIRWDQKGKTGRRKFGYVVAFDEENRFEDYRTPVRRRSRASGTKRVEPAEYGVPAYLRSAYLWVFIFKRDRWAHHHYEIVGEEKLFDRTAVYVVERITTEFAVERRGLRFPGRVEPRHPLIPAAPAARVAPPALPARITRHGTRKRSASPAAR